MSIRPSLGPPHSASPMLQPCRRWGNECHTCGKDSRELLRLNRVGGNVLALGADLLTIELDDEVATDLLEVHGIAVWHEDLEELSIRDGAGAPRISREDARVLVELFREGVLEV